MTLKIAAFAPMPTASVTSVTTVKSGALQQAADGERETGPGHIRPYDRVSAKVSARARKVG